MKSVLIRLEGPIQSWGTQGRFALRDTDTEPSKSGVIGFVGAAMGLERDDGETLSRLARLEMAVRVDREGVPLRDWHTAGGGVFRGGAHHVFGTKAPVITTRFYLSDASFLVGLGGEDHELVERIEVALTDPKWPLFLGRKSCVPSVAPLVGIRPYGPAEALRREPLAPDARSMVRMVVECGPSEGAVARQDVPLSFALYERRHGRRFVTTEWIAASDPGGGEEDA